MKNKDSGSNDIDVEKLESQVKKLEKAMKELDITD